MQTNNDTSTRFTNEVKVIPTWAWVLAGLAFVCAQVLFNTLLAKQSDAPPAWARVLLGLMAGAVLACYLLLIGYVNRDAGRRGMSRLLWTSVAVLIPNALGILLYFLLRRPLHSACPQCGNAVQAGFDFCPRCSCKLGMSCPRCKRVLSAGVVGALDAYCPYCGAALHGQNAPDAAVRS